MADTKLTALTEISVPALEDLFYTVDDPAGTAVSNKITGTRLSGLLVPQVCQGRLTTESGVPVSTSDRTSQGTLYWTPCTADGSATASGLVGFYDGTRYVVASLSQLSLDLSTAEAGGAIDVGENYDVFIDYNGGSPALVLSAAWTNDTTRSTALVTQGPLVVLTGNTDWRWVGTIRASGSGVTEDSAAKRYVGNANNALPRLLRFVDVTSHTYSSTTPRYWNNSSASRAEFVTPGSQRFTFSLNGTVTVSKYGVVEAVLDWTSGSGTAGTDAVLYNPRDADNAWVLEPTGNATASAGFHYIAAVETGNGAGPSMDRIAVYAMVRL